jgi:hypothetical protein
MHLQYRRDVRRVHLDHYGIHLVLHLVVRRLDGCLGDHRDRVHRQQLPFAALLLGLDAKASLLVMDDVRRPDHQTVAYSRGYLDDRRHAFHLVASGVVPFLHLGVVQDDRLRHHRKKMGY